MHLEMTAVESNQVESVGYDGAAQTLAVKFRRGGVYLYKGVPANEHTELMAAPSIGSHLAKRIKGVYECEKQPEYPA